LGGMDAEVGGRRRGGWGASGHAGDYKTGEGTRKKITRRRRVRGEAQRREKQIPRSARDDSTLGWRVTCG
jgi:hypothetical protein